METYKDDTTSKKSKGRAVDMETVSCDDDDVEQQLIHRLLKGHDEHVRPVRNRDQNVNVGFDISYNQLVDLVRLLWQTLDNFINFKKFFQDVQ